MLATSECGKASIDAAHFKSIGHTKFHASKRSIQAKYISFFITLHQVYHNIMRNDVSGENMMKCLPFQTNCRMSISCNFLDAKLCQNVTFVLLRSQKLHEIKKVKG